MVSSFPQVATTGLVFHGISGFLPDIHDTDSMSLPYAASDDRKLKFHFTFISSNIPSCHAHTTESVKETSSISSCACCHPSSGEYH
jgi:hypothetical protein